MHCLLSLKNLNKNPQRAHTVPNSVLYLFPPHKKVFVMQKHLHHNTYKLRQELESTAARRGMQLQWGNTWHCPILLRHSAHRTAFTNPSQTPKSNRDWGLRAEDLPSHWSTLTFFIPCLQRWGGNNLKTPKVTKKYPIKMFLKSALRCCIQHLCRELAIYLLLFVSAGFFYKQKHFTVISLMVKPLPQSSKLCTAC